jgi:hypothetical protein
MAVRMRVVGWEVRPIVMADDGDTLTAVPVAPQTIAATAWTAFKDGGDLTALEHLRSQIERESDASDAARRPHTGY